MYEIAVCDDCAADRKRLIEYINAEQAHYKLCIHEFESGLALLKEIEYTQFSVLFLDIQMADTNGDVIAQEIRKLDSNLILVFYTGFVEPSPQSFEVQPYRYIMKNMTSQQISKYVKAALNKAVENEAAPKLLANINKKQIFIDPKHVVYIEKYKKSTKVHLVNNAYKIYKIEKDSDMNYPDIRLSDPLEITYGKLKRFGFGCPHSSYIVNFNYLRTCTSKSLRLVGVSGEFSIARSKAKTFIEAKGHYIRAKYAGGNAQ